MNIVAAFDSASHSYDGAAQIQTEVAAQLIADAAGLAPRRILDIGCGTGLLTAMAQQRWPAAAITALDAAPAMLDAARAKLPSVHFVQADAAAITLTEKFDLILSSMVLHWLADPVAVITQWQTLLAPNGTLLVAVPVAGSLSEWNTLCDSHALPSRVWRFPAPELFGRDATLRYHSIAHATAHDFLRSMKRTGAAVPDPATTPTQHAVLRRMLQAAPKPFAATFTIATLRHTKPGAQTKTGPHCCEPASS